MQVVSFKLLAMLNEHIVPVGSRIASLYDAAIACSVNGGAAGCGIVCSAMGSLGFVDRMQALGIEV